MNADKPKGTDQGSMSNRNFEPPHSVVDQTEGDEGARAKAVAAGVLGLLYGYLLWTSPIRVPVGWVIPLVPGIKSAMDGLPTDSAYALASALVFFLMVLPNTVLVSVLCALTVRFTRQSRWVVYMSLVWPLMAFSIFWLNLFSIMRGAKILGVDAQMIVSIKQSQFAPLAIMIALIYALFLPLVFLLLRLADARFGTGGRKPVDH